MENNSDFWWMLALATPTVITVIAIFTAYGKYKEWKGEVNSDRKSFTEFMTEIRKDINKIFDRLPSPQTTAGSSPLGLTEFGEKISTDLEVKKVGSKDCE